VSKDEVRKYVWSNFSYLTHDDDDSCPRPIQSTGNSPISLSTCEQYNTISEGLLQMQWHTNQPYCKAENKQPHDRQDPEKPLFSSLLNTGTMKLSQH
jgi:hypothetical protein